MSDSSEQYPTGTYRKGDRVRVARTPGEAVAAAFEGFQLDTRKSAAKAKPTENASEATPVVNESAPDNVAKPAPPKSPKS